MGAISPQVLAMQKAGFTEEEIADVLATDKAIDRGAKLFELDESLRPGAKKARRADRTDAPKPRTRAVDADKAEIMGVLSDALADLVDNVGEVTNERILAFEYNERKYKLTLSIPRGQ